MLPITKVPFPNGSYRNGVCRALWILSVLKQNKNFCFFFFLAGQFPMVAASWGGGGQRSEQCSKAYPFSGQQRSSFFSRPLKRGIYGIHLASLTTALGHATCFMPKGLNFLFHSYKCCYFCAIPARRWSTAATMMRSNAEHRVAKPKNHIDT